MFGGALRMTTPDAQRRLIAATIDGMRVIDVYIPNGSEVGSEKYGYKLDWLAKLRAVSASGSWTDQGQALICGDFNIAPTDEDVHDPELWAGKVLCSEAERDGARVDPGQWGWIDLFRRHHPGGRPLLVVGLPGRWISPQPRTADRPHLGDERAGRALRRGLDRQDTAGAGEALRSRAGRRRSSELLMTERDLM
jgi:hypothetical protein